MSDRPVFIYAATYADVAGAEADYDALLELHAAKLVGTYDIALVTKDADGKVHVEKHEKPTQHGAWGGLAVGAAVGRLGGAGRSAGGVARRHNRRPRRALQKGNRQRRRQGDGGPHRSRAGYAARDWGVAR